MKSCLEGGREEERKEGHRKGKRKQKRNKNKEKMMEREGREGSQNPKHENEAVVKEDNSVLISSQRQC